MGQNWRSYSLNNDPHQKCSTSNRLVAKIIFGIELTSGETPQQTWNFSKEKIKIPHEIKGLKRCTRRVGIRDPMIASLTQYH